MRPEGSSLIVASSAGAVTSCVTHAADCTSHADTLYVSMAAPLPAGRSQVTCSASAVSPPTSRSPTVSGGADFVSANTTSRLAEPRSYEFSARISRRYRLAGAIAAKLVSSIGAVQVEVHAPYPSSGMKATALPPPVVPTKSVSWKRITPSSTMPWFMCHETSNERDASLLTATFCGVLGASDLTDGTSSGALHGPIARPSPAPRVATTRWTKVYSRPASRSDTQ